MEKSLSNTWIIIQIGEAEYCINSEYVKGVAELSKAEYQKPVSYSGIMRGIYKIYAANIPVLDGRRLLGYTSIDEERLNFSEKIHNLKYKHMTLLDDLEWSIMTKDVFSKSLNMDESALSNWLQGTEFKDKKLDHTVQNMLAPLKVIYSLANKALCSRSEISYTQAHNLITEIKRQSELYIIKGLNALIEIHNKSIVEMCVVIRCKGIDFGISADTIVSISEQSGDISKVCKDRLSAGAITIRDSEYNIINLTKITNLIKVQEV